MKKKLVAALLLGLSVLAVGCSGNNTKETSAATTAGTETQASGAASEKASGSEEVSEAAAETQKQTEPVEYKALDYVTLGEYKGLEVSYQKVEVTDDEVTAEIQSQITQQNKLVDVKDGVVQDGDVANIDYEGKVNGKAVDGATDKGTDLTIGSNTFFEGFESGLIGVKVGESKDLNLTFPENYTEELKNKPVVFHVTVNSIKRSPELTDELAEQLSGEATVADYKEKIKTTLLQQKAQGQESALKSEVVMQAAKNSKVNDYPKDLVAQRMTQMTDLYTSYATQSQMTFEEFIKANMDMSLEDFNKKAEETIKVGLDQEMTLKAISEKENLAISDAEYKAGVKKYSQDYGFEKEEDFTNEYSKNVIEMSLIQDKVLQLLMDNAVISNPEDKIEIKEEKTTEAGTEKETQADAEKATDIASEKSSETEAATEKTTEAATDKATEKAE